MLILVLMILFAMIAYLSKKGMTLSSPVMIIVYVYLLSYLGGYFFFDRDLADMPKFFSNNTSTSGQTVVELMGLLLAVILGAFLNLKLGGRHVIAKRMVFPNIALSKKMVYVPILSIILCIFGNGVEDVIYRRTYLVAAYPIVKVIGEVMIFPATALLGYYFYSTKGMFKYFSLFLFATIELMHLSLSTRIFAFTPILFTSGGLLTRNFKFARKMLILSVLAAPFLVMIPINLRGDTEQGLVPLFEKIENGGLVGDRFGFLNSMNNMFFGSFPLADYTLTHAPVDLDYVLVNLNPLPGFMTSWSSIHSRVNEAIPYSGVAEMIKYNYLLVLIIYLLIGFYVSKLETISKERNNVVLLISTYMLFSLFSILTTQYAFRSSMRAIYYLICIHISLVVLSRLRNRKRAFASLARRKANAEFRAEWGVLPRKKNSGSLRWTGRMLASDSNEGTGRS